MQRQTQTLTLRTRRAGRSEKFTAKTPPAPSQHLIIIRSAELNKNPIAQRSGFAGQIRTLIPGCLEALDFDDVRILRHTGFSLLGVSLTGLLPSSGQALVR